MRFGLPRLSTRRNLRETASTPEVFHTTCRFALLPKGVPFDEEEPILRVRNAFRNAFQTSPSYSNIMKGDEHLSAWGKRPAGEMSAECSQQEWFLSRSKGVDG